jgi:hypothetical protein
MPHTYFSFVVSFVSLSVVGGIFTYRLLEAFLQFIFLPTLDMSILPGDIFNNLNLNFDNNKKIVRYSDKSTGNIKYTIQFGAFLKELFIWVIMMGLLYFLLDKTK